MQLVLLATGALAQDSNPAVEARKAHMDLYAFNLGLLGGMARGNIDYDADAASAAASNLATLTKLDQSRYWEPGTDSDTLVETRALPAIWENMADVGAKSAAMREAALAMQAAAGTDLASLQAAMGALGGACGDCHKAYRTPQ